MQTDLDQALFRSIGRIGRANLSSVERALVVGAGILGSMHALYLHRAGLEVLHVEASSAPSGASVRNFGLVWVSGRRMGPELDAALAARVAWEELSADIPGVGFRPEGSLTVAVDPAERKVMEEYAALGDAPSHGTTFVEPDELRRINPSLRGDVAGGLWCERDAIVEPRAALGAIRGYLNARPGYRYVPGRRIVEVEPGEVTDHLGQRWSADLVVMATGAWHDGVLGQHFEQAPVRRVRLQMLQTEPFDELLTTSVVDADSLRYYPAYEASDFAALAAPTAMATHHHLQLLMVQRAGGELTIGDTHAYDEPFEFDLDEAPSLELVERASRILGRPVPPVARRWEGVYSQCTVPDGLWHRAQVTDGVWVVTGPGGRGMTCSPAIAQETVHILGLS